MAQEGGKEAEDPSMEDILASIRRILNDDEPAAEAGADSPGGAAAMAHQPAPAPAPAADPASAVDDVFDLDQSMLVQPPPAAPPAAVIPAVVPAVEAPPPPRPAPPEPPIQPQQAPPAMTQAPPAPSQVADDPADALMAPSTAAAASASMGALVRVVSQQQTQIYRSGGPTLEDMVRDELRPMVKSWLDEHLAPMVERLVRAEIARVTEGK